MTHTACRPLAAYRQRGVTLIELMVGITIGLLTVAVAMGALMVSRGVSGTVSDASDIQQQGAYVMRVIGQQMRQAGSLKLDITPGFTSPADAASDPLAHLLPVGLETSATDWQPSTDTLAVLDDTPIVGFSHYTELLTTGEGSQSVNCKGEGGGDAVKSHFRLQNNELQCGDGSATSYQAIVRNVADFQVRYLLQDNATNPGIPQIRYASASDVEDVVNGWTRVQAVEVCVVLYGTEPIDLPAGSSYTGCNSTAVDMTTLTGARARRMHIAFRNIFQLRSQGLAGAML